MAHMAWQIAVSNINKVNILQRKYQAYQKCEGCGKSDGGIMALGGRCGA